MKKIKREYYFISVLLILFVILTMFVVKGSIDDIDKLVFDNLIKVKNSFITEPLRVITHMASTVGIIIMLFITALVFLKRKCFSDFKYVIANVGTGVILMKLIKHIIRRARPSWKWIVQGGFSYPSGHTITSFLLYGTLILLISKKVEGKYKKPLMIFFGVMIFLTALSRVYFGAHYFSDVLASILLGTIVLIVSNNFMNKEFKHDKDKNK